MKIWSRFFFIAITLLIFSSGCKTEFEQVRISGDPKLLYEKGMEYYQKGDYLRAQTLLELAIPSYRGRREGEDLFFNYAYTQYYLGKYILAAYYFENFANSFSASPKREEAEYMVAYSHYQLSPNYRLDQTYTQKAIEEFQEFANAYPSSDRIDRVNILIDEMRRKLEQKAFANAELYYNLRQYKSAIQSFDNLLKDFPETLETEKVRYLIVKSNYLLADNSVLDKRAERFRDTQEAYENFVRKYPNSSFLKELDKLMESVNTKLKELEDV